MNRRNLIKGLVALPVATAVGAQAKLCGGTTHCPTASNPLTLTFDGPFSLVLQTASGTSDDITGVIAFTPVEPNGMHLFKLNGVPYDETEHYDFTLNIPGFNPPSRPCITKSLSSFCTDHTTFNATAGLVFISVKLPCPNTITNLANLKPISATVGGGKVNMPRGHMLVYDIPATSKATLDQKGATQPVSPIANNLLFAVGMDPAAHPDADCSHAASFYNKSMLPFFPDLANNTITIAPGDCPAAITPATKASQGHGPFQLLGSTFECKGGGLIVTSP